MKEIDAAQRALNNILQQSRGNSFPVINQLRSRAKRGLEDEGLYLAAFICDTAKDTKNPLEISALLTLLNEEPSSKSDALALVNASTLLCAAIQDHKSEHDKRTLAQIANYLGTPLMVERCRLLVECRIDLTEDEFIDLMNFTIEVQQLLAHPELLEGTHSTLEDVRRDEAKRLVEGAEVSSRINSAPSAFILAHSPEEIASSVMQLHPMPVIGNSTVTIKETSQENQWQLRVVTNDQQALLARITDALHEAGLNILGADLATWPDGAVLDTFIVHSLARVSIESVQDLINDRIRNFDVHNSLIALPTHCTVHVDEIGHPTNTIIHVSGPDQPGLLSHIAAAFALSAVAVHHATIETLQDQIADSFEVTDLAGNKLTKDKIAHFMSLVTSKEP